MALQHIRKSIRNFWITGTDIFSWFVSPASRKHLSYDLVQHSVTMLVWETMRKLNMARVPALVWFCSIAWHILTSPNNNNWRLKYLPTETHFQILIFPSNTIFRSSCFTRLLSNSRRFKKPSHLKTCPEVQVLKNGIIYSDTKVVWLYFPVVATSPTRQGRISSYLKAVGKRL